MFVKFKFDWDDIGDGDGGDGGNSALVAVLLLGWFGCNAN